MIRPVPRLRMASKYRELDLGVGILENLAYRGHLILVKNGYSSTFVKRNNILNILQV